jgi:Helix-turn-helix domain
VTITTTHIHTHTQEIPKMNKKITPPELAKQWGISPEKVLVWITSGELRAIDASTHRGQRPRYLIDVDDLAAFERSRAVTPPPVSTPRRRRPNVPQYV